MQTQEVQVPKNRFRNNAKVVAIGQESFDRAVKHGVSGQLVNYGENDRLVNAEGHEFVNFSSCSYLGLNTHPKILEGAINTLREQGFWRLSIAPVRVSAEIYHRVEQELSDLFQVNATLTPSCSATSEGVLPLLASGVLTKGEKPTMIFDRHCHFSMAVIIPHCADETDVYTSKHNDLDFVEDICRKHGRVAYVADGAYSMGGSTLMDGLKTLQEKYGMFLYLDDSHSLSICGERGEGFVRREMPGPLNENTLIVSSLSKAFGASGGVVMSGDDLDDMLFRRWGGPLGWSQNVDTAACGALLASCDLHRSPELGVLQGKLKANLRLFDSLVETPQKGNDFPIRMVVIGDEDDAIKASGELFSRGYYCSAVFFPIVGKGKAGIRVMLRSNSMEQDIRDLSSHLLELRQKYAK